MSYILAGYSSGYPLYRDTDTNDCYLMEDDVLVYWGTCPSSQVPINSPQIPPFIGGGVSTGQYIPPGQSWFNDILNTLLGLSAIGAGGTIQGGSINPQQQPVYPPYSPNINPNVSPNVNANAGANIGSSLQTFVTQNFTFIALSVGVYLLYKSGRK